MLMLFRPRLHVRLFSTCSKDSYFALVNHISHIVRTDHFLERTLSRLRPRPPLSPSFTLRILSSTSSHPVPSLRFFLWALPLYSPTSQEFHSLLLTLSRHRLFPSFWSLAHRMLSPPHSHPFPPSLLPHLLRSYSDAGHLPTALRLFNSAPRPPLLCPQSTPLYNALLHALVSHRLLPAAYALVRRMARKNVPLDRTTYSTLVNAWCSAGKLREAQSFLDEMASRGLSPPVRGRDLLIDALVNAGYLESAKSLLTGMAKQGSLPDVSTFNSLTEALCKSGEIDFCLGFLNEASEMGLCPDISTYKAMIPAAARAGRIEEAFRLLYCAMEEGHRPFPSLYAGIVKGLCKAGRFGDAFSFFGDMKEKGHPPNRPVYTMLVKMCVRGGRFVDAANFLVEMTEMGMVPRGQSFDIVVEGLKHCGKHDLARRMEQMEVSLRRDSLND